MSENELEEPRIKLELSDESKELLERLRTQQKIEAFARDGDERDALARARSRSHADSTSLVSSLLRLLVESENERGRTHGFVGKIQGLERQLYVVRRERDTFSDEVDHLKRQVDACHAKIGELKNDADKSTTQKRELSEFLKNAMDENRALKASNRTVCIRDMFVRVLPHQERNDRPTVPSEVAIRLQTRIDAEEFVEKIEALYDDPLVSSLGKILYAIAKHGTIRPDLHDRLPEFADALADNAVTNEGFAVLFGIDLEPVFQEVHASNMRKGDGPIVDGKRRKPEGWVGPDVVGVLRKQGWSPFSESKVDEPIPYALNCPAHGMLTAHETIWHEQGGGMSCTRCENAQYNGSEIDPVGEQSGNETAALAYLAKEAAKIDPKLLPKVPQRNAVPIDVTIWNRSEFVRIEVARVSFGDMSVCCGVDVIGEGDDRRIVARFVANDERLRPFEEARSRSQNAILFIDGTFFDLVTIDGIYRGLAHYDLGFWAMIEFRKVD